MINDFFIWIRIFLNFEVNVSYIDNVLIDELNFNFVKSIDSINVQLANKFYMSSDRQICCNFQINTYIENTIIHFFDFIDFDMMLKYEWLRIVNFVINWADVSMIIKNIRKKQYIIRFQSKQKRYSKQIFWLISLFIMKLKNQFWKSIIWKLISCILKFTKISSTTKILTLKNLSICLNVKINS